MGIRHDCDLFGENKMIDEEERSLIALGVREAIDKLGNNLHSEDDHGYDLYQWLKKKEEEIIQSACIKIEKGRAMLID